MTLYNSEYINAGTAPHFNTHSHAQATLPNGDHTTLTLLRIHAGPTASHLDILSHRAITLRSSKYVHTMTITHLNTLSHTAVTCQSSDHIHVVAICIQVVPAPYLDILNQEVVIIAE